MPVCEGKPLDTFTGATTYTPDNFYFAAVDMDQPQGSRSRKITPEGIFSGWTGGDMPIKNNHPAGNILFTLKNAGGVDKTVINMFPTAECAEFSGVRYLQRTISADSDAVSVRGFPIIIVDTTAGNVTIGGFADGTTGQVITVIKTVAANNLILEHEEPTGVQKIITKDTLDITFSGRGMLRLAYLTTTSRWYVQY